MKLYLNGELKNQEQVPFTFLDYQQVIAGNSNGKNLIGGNSSVSRGDYGFFHGYIDDIGVWNRALTEQEILALYNASCDIDDPVITSNGNTTICQGQFVQLTSTYNQNYSYKWFKDGNEISGATSYQYTANESGDYSIRAYEDGCYEESEAVSVTVNEIPDIVIEGLGQMYYTSDDAVTLIGSPTGGVFYGEGVSGTMFSP